MDLNISKDSFNQMIQNAYPTYLLKLSQICFSRCAKREGEGRVLSDSETECIDVCSRTYVKNL
jgi:hypothetical protein